MKILITGASGQFSKELLHILKTDISLPSEFKAATILPLSKNQLNIADLQSTLDGITKLSPNLIINGAAFTDVDSCEEYPEIAMKVNALGPRNLALSAEKVHATLVHLSTDYVFSGTEKTPKAEWDLAQPKTIYGKSKRLGEKYIEQFCSKYFIIRSAWMYSIFGHNFVKSILKQGLAKKPLAVVNDQFGNPTCAEDLIYQILELIITDEFGLYHCTNQGTSNWYEFACEILELFNLTVPCVPCTTEESSRKATRPSYSSLENMALEASSIGNSMKPWKIALKDYVKKNKKNFERDLL